MSRVYIDQYIRAFKCEYLKYIQLFRCASDFKKHDIIVYLMHSGLKIEKLIAIESLGKRIGVVCRDTAAYTIYIMQDHSQDKLNSLGFEEQCIIVLVPEIEEFKDLNQFYFIAPLQDPIRQDLNSQLVTNDLARPYKYTLSNNSIVAGMSATIIHLLRWPVLIIYKLVDPHNYTTLSKPVQLPTSNTLYNKK